MKKMSKLDIFGDGHESGSRKDVKAKELLQVPIKVYCQTCGCERPLKIKKRLEDFHVVEEYYACSVCGKRLELPEEKESCGNPGKPSVLDILPDEPQSEHGNLLPDLDDEIHFCRDCSHYLFHPFQSRCCLYDKAVEPTNDCSSYKKRTKESTSL